MKKLFVATALTAGLVSMPLQAEILGAGVGAGIWNQSYSGQASINNTQIIDGNEFKSNKNNYVWGYLNHPIPVLPNVKLEYAQVDTTQNNNLLNLDQTDLTLYWGLPVPVVDLDFGLTVKKFDGKLVGNNETEKVDALVPMGYLSLKAPLPFVPVTLGADTKVISYNGSSINDSKITARWDVVDSVVKLGVELGYRKQNIDIDGFGQDVRADMSIDGWFAGVALVF